MYRWTVRLALALPAVAIGLVLAMLVAGRQPAGAQAGVTPRVIGHEGGVVNAVLPSESFLLWSKGAELEVWTADGSARLGGLMLSGVIEDIALAEGRGYVAVGTAGLDVIDLGQPSEPRHIQHIALPDLDPEANTTALAVAIRDGHAYVALYEGGLWVLDLSQPTAAGTVTGAWVSHLMLAGDFLLTWDALSGHNDGYDVWDVSQPGQPQRLGLSATLGRAAGLARHEGYLFVANEHGEFEIRAWDPGQPLSASLVSQLDLGMRLTAVAVSADGTTAFAATPQGVAAIDVANPAQPALRHVLHGAPGAELAARGNRVYVAGGPEALRVLAYDGQELTPLAERGLRGVSLGGALAGQRLYLAQDQHGVARLNVSQPAQPTVTGTVALEPWSQALSVAAAQSGLAVAYDNRLALVDPDSLAVLGTVELPDRAYAVVTHGQTAFVAASYAGVCVVDVSRADMPSLIGCAQTPGEAYDVALAGDTLFVAEAQHGVTARDAADASLTIKAHYADARAFAVAAEGRQVFVSDLSVKPRLLVLEYAPGEGLSLADAWPTRGFASAIKAAGGLIYLADKIGLQVVRRDAGGINVWAVYESPGTALQALVDGETVYLIDGRNGVVVLNVTGSPAGETPGEGYRLYLPLLARTP
jgi:hypothetical protein